MLVQLLVPLGVCVALPVLIVWIVFRTESNKTNKSAQVLIEAIKANADIDTTALAKALAKPRKTPREVLFGRLLKGCVLSFIGLAFLICFIYMYVNGEADSEDVLVALFLGLVSLGIGVAFLIVYFVTRKQLPYSDKTEEKE